MPSSTSTNPFLSASARAVDPTLASLFASSAGPASAPNKSRSYRSKEYNAATDHQEATSIEPTSSEEDSSGEETIIEPESVRGGSSQANQNDNDTDSEDDDDSSEAGSDRAASPPRKRKRGLDDDDTLEARYFTKLARTEASEGPAKQRKGKTEDATSIQEDASTRSDDDTEEEDDDDDNNDNGGVPVHESISHAPGAVDLTKDEATRTVYLANISTEAVVSKSAKRSLLSHLRLALDPDAKPAQCVEKLRFRSLPVSSTKMPKKAAFITRSLLDSTTKAAQAYAVYSTQAAARNSARKLNGTIVLGRHLRADLNAHPDEKDHRRCVYVGNLNFVDDETNIDVNSGEEGSKRKKSKVPADVEEGLWQTFSSKAGEVEFVRVPRDPHTRVGKGFAYVQFKDGTAVEKALLLDGKKFPPMLPRPVRVTRCRDPRRTARALEKKNAKANASIRDVSKATRHRPKESEEQKTDMGRAARLLGKGGAFKVRRESRLSGRTRNHVSQNGSIQAPEQIVLEGRRASERDGKPSGMKFGKTKSKGKSYGGRPNDKRSRRAAEWKKARGRK